MKKCFGVLFVLFMTLPLYASICPQSYEQAGKHYSFYSASYSLSAKKVMCSYGTENADGTFSDMHVETIKDVKDIQQSSGYWKTMRQQGMDFHVCLVQPADAGNTDPSKKVAKSAADCEFFLKNNEQGRELLVK